MRHAAGESADALQFLGLHVTVLRCVCSASSVWRVRFLSRVSRRVWPAGEHEQQCEDQRDRNQADLRTQTGSEAAGFHTHDLVDFGIALDD